METRIAVALALGLQLAATAGAAAQGADAKKPAAAPSAAVSNSVVAQEQLIYDAIARKDTVAFNKAVGRDFVYVDETGAMRWSLAKTSTIFAECGLGTGWTIDHPMTTEVGSDLVVLTYSASANATCKGQRVPSPVNAMSVWQRRGGRWVAVAHSETAAKKK
jgi:Domain of unknown function (DUF4440)